MITFFDILSFVLTIAYSFVFFVLVKTFLPLRKNIFLKIVAFIVFSVISDSVIYSNDLANLLGSMTFFFIYLLIFYQGKFLEKVSVLLVFYPALIAVNYLMLDIGSRIFFGITHASPEEVDIVEEFAFLSTAIHTLSLLLRLVFWMAAWRILHRYLSKITSHLNTKMWLIIDMLMLASFVAIFTIIYFMPENAVIVYPICGASIFSSFGCMYLAFYICNAMQTAYKAQDLEKQRNYYKDRIKDEERVRSIYHDMKNHLLVLESRQGTEDTKEMAKKLRSQIADYENYIHTGNDFLDILLKDKMEKAREKQINLSIFIDFDGTDFIGPLDISTIFGNGLDNAIEASERLPTEQRVILVKAGRIQNFLFVVMENNCVEEKKISKRRTTKDDDFLHGFGISNIEKAIEKYNGQLTTKCEHEKFILKILIPIS